VAVSEPESPPPPPCPGATEFSVETIRELGLTDEQAKQLQLFVDRRVVLVNETLDASTIVEGGRIVMRDGKEVREMILPACTPGIPAQLLKGRIRTALEEQEVEVIRAAFGSSDNETLQFVSQQGYYGF
jgi:hypothetical protein